MTVASSYDAITAFSWKREAVIFLFSPKKLGECDKYGY